MSTERGSGAEAPIQIAEVVLDRIKTVLLIFIIALAWQPFGPDEFVILTDRR